MKKILIACVLAATMGLSLVACSGSSSSTPAAGGDSSTGTSTSQPADSGSSEAGSSSAA